MYDSSILMTLCTIFIRLNLFIHTQSCSWIELWNYSGFSSIEVGLRHTVFVVTDDSGHYKPHWFSWINLRFPCSYLDEIILPICKNSSLFRLNLLFTSPVKFHSNFSYNLLLHLCWRNWTWNLIEVKEVGIYSMTKG